MDSTNWKKFKSWVGDFDKERTLFVLGPLVVLAFVGLVLAFPILIKLPIGVWETLFK